MKILWICLKTFCVFPPWSPFKINFRPVFFILNFLIHYRYPVVSPRSGPEMSIGLNVIFCAGNLSTEDSIRLGSWGQFHPHVYVQLTSSDPKNVKSQSSHWFHFALLGSSCAKATHKTCGWNWPQELLIWLNNPTKKNYLLHF